MMEEHKKYIVKGKEYTRIEGVPEPFREMLQKAEDTALQAKISGGGDAPQIQVTQKTTKYVVNGKEYERVEDMPESARRILEDKNQNGIPDILENMGLKAEIKKEVKVDVEKETKLPSAMPTGVTDPFAPPSQDKLKFIIFALVAIGLLVYYLLSQ